MHKSLAALLALVALTAGACANPSTPSDVRVLSLSGALDFGDVVVGKEVTKSVVIENKGKGELTVSSISSGPLSDVVLVSSRAIPFVIPPAASASVFVTFRPSTAQAYVGTLKIVADQTSGTDVVDVRGTGLPLPKANLEWIEPLVYTCIPDYCYNMVMPVTNTGAGCATDVDVVAQAYGDYGNGPKLGVPVPIGAYGYFFRPGQTIRLTSLNGFNDVRSVSTRFRATIKWRDVPCP